MEKYYFRVEAVNLDSSVYDTNDISTIRGGSFMIQDAIKTAYEQVKKVYSKQLSCISTAASIGLFKLNSENETEVDEIIRLFMEQVNSATPDFGTFAHAKQLISKEKTFTQHLTELTNICRRIQYQSPTLVLPSVEGSENQDEYCQFDGLRPAIKEITKGENTKKWASHATIKRQEKGKKLRNKLYFKLTNNKPVEHIDTESPFTNDLEKLSKSSDAGKLDGIIAFIYIDGNRFGTIRERLCKDENLYEKFQTKVQTEIQETAFKDIVEYAQQEQEKSFLTPTKNKKYQIRMETLLWGGDEIEWVVPAWQAFKVINILYECLSGCEKFEGVNLTYSAGVVFCHHNVPILQVRKFAHQLCDLAKKKLDPDINKLNQDANRYAYLNMTSFDMVAGDLENFLKRYYAPATDYPNILSIENFSSTIEQLKVIKKIFPRNKLFDIINAVQKNDSKKIEAILERVYLLIGTTKADKLKSALTEIIKDDNNYNWFIIADLLDYTGDVNE